MLFIVKILYRKKLIKKIQKIALFALPTSFLKVSAYDKLYKVNLNSRSSLFTASNKPRQASVVTSSSVNAISNLTKTTDNKPSVDIDDVKVKRSLPMITSSSKSRRNSNQQRKLSKHVSKSENSRKLPLTLLMFVVSFVVSSAPWTLTLVSCSLSGTCALKKDGDYSQVIPFNYKKH